MNDHNLSVLGSISMKFSLQLELSKICAVTMSTALVWLPYPAKKDKFSMKLCAWGCESHETRWVGRCMAGSNGRRLLVESCKEANGG